MVMSNVLRGFKKNKTTALTVNKNIYLLFLSLIAVSGTQAETFYSEIVRACTHLDVNVSVGVSKIP